MRPRDLDADPAVWKGWDRDRRPPALASRPAFCFFSLIWSIFVPSLGGSPDRKKTKPTASRMHGVGAAECVCYACLVLCQLQVWKPSGFPRGLWRDGTFCYCSAFRQVRCYALQSTTDSASRPLLPPEWGD
ncbi:hypothetical protein B0T21DRAFT_39279 [Apiosordaria backusii]|uniref:Uncharacterized protein n=1 Tax=Apiosordaria backusii TaxID=314023 RepID=A0AA40AX76_9PEZI|nr:hypothetical protein B0T21DRAFT_39279 [Apiosordaria backusii]